MPTSFDDVAAGLTILTQPPRSTTAYVREIVRRVRYRRGRPTWGGPPSVARNLMIGLERAAVPFRFDPAHGRIGPHVGVLTHIDTLRHVITLKGRGRADWLVAGPNLVVAPHRSGRVLCSDHIDRVVVASPWVRDMFLAYAPELAARIAVWPVGVDEERWCPAERPVPLQGDVLIYVKSGPARILDVTSASLSARGLRYTILRYGRYRPAEYLALLRSHRWMLFLSESETQGIALFEAWATGVPTLVWDRGRCTFEDIDWPGASSAPYLAAANGRRFSDPIELDAAIEEMERSAFDPRGFILGRYTARETAIAYTRLFPPHAS